MRRALIVGAVAAVLTLTGGVGVAQAEVGGPDRPDTLTVPGDVFHPESITAAANGDLYTASIVTGEIVRFRGGRGEAETFVEPGVNPGTAGILVDDARRVLWACNIDLSFQQPTSLRAFSLTSGRVVADYELPDRGVCADVTLADGAVYLSDTTDPTASPALPGRILKLTTPRSTTARGGDLEVWSSDPALTGPVPGLQINGLAYDGAGSLLTTNYSSGQLLRVAIEADGSAGPAREVTLSRPLTRPDGIRMLNRVTLAVAENPGRVDAIDLRTGTVTVISDQVDQPTSVVRVGRSLWVAEGQVLRLQAGETPNLPFTLRRLDLPRGP